MGKKDASDVIDTNRNYGGVGSIAVTTVVVVELRKVWITPLFPLWDKIKIYIKLIIIPQLNNLKMVDMQ